MTTISMGRQIEGHETRRITTKDKNKEKRHGRIP